MEKPSIIIKTKIFQQYRQKFHRQSLLLFNGFVIDAFLWFGEN